ncbi:MAG: mannose-1-phosphate guanylyltransferase [Phycisphaera sp.]|nr:MAG: mannose-1-phosphate guanylyltransferase [Phycisphaera sp.]
MDEHRYAMVMAGGSGTRLWPMSRKERPKQLLRFLMEPGRDSPRSLIEVSAGRLDGLVPQENLLVCTLERYSDAVAGVLPQLGKGQILGEPVGRDTVNAVGLTAAVLASKDPEAAFCVMTADHVIEPVDHFQSIVRQGFELVEQHPRTLVTFAIEPTHPATGYGYVRRGEAIDGTNGLGFQVEKFVEKPDEGTAKAYLAEGVYGWNSGMFVWKASTFLDCLKSFLPASYDGLTEIARAWDTPDRSAVLHRVYPELEKKSVDYAIMEPATSHAAKNAIGGPIDVATLRMDVSWLDVGSWASYAGTVASDDANNRVAGIAEGTNAIAHDSKGNLIVNNEQGHSIALLGCEDLVVVHTKGATLIMPAAKAESLKDLHAALPNPLL